ncbi:hypothetical protein PDESU_00255 [Pontiella desulfatans]|uniref:Aldose 1-epimerase n=1 Tax=Pontiella desulfatans TaxID=2750659 RepID=A0A6C2TVS0_PONDE|nr:aldose 1-epimerase family protein [Pontiella desulfatans]VGO11709.1 hypothetical protein PDESU_00255 [Pontiella desulfatans]
MITIENEQFSATVDLRGAELRSFKEKSTGREMMWQADPEIWGGSAPILFPIVGKLRDGKTRINGQTYGIPKHGLVRTRTAKCIEQGRDVVVFSFSSDAETLQHYPFTFTLEVEFRLDGKQLLIDYRVKNEGAEEMLFTIGSHPALALDLEQAALDGYDLEFEKPESLDLYGLTDGLLAFKQGGYLENNNCIRLSETLFDDDALIFKNIRSRRVRLKPRHRTGGLEIDLGNCPHLGIWAKPGAAYVCIEPWHSYDDAPDSNGNFENKPGILRLAPAETFETGYAIRMVG